MKKFLLSIFAVLFAFAGVQAQSYVKVTSAPADWSGDYLIVYEAGKVAFNGGLTTLDATSNTISVTINNNEIEANATINAAKFTIAKSGTAYTVKSASGYYIGRNSAKNGLDSNKTTAYTNTITYTNGKVVIASSNQSTYSLQYNKTSGQTRFRYFGSAQEAIALYKYTEGGSTEPETPEPEPDPEPETPVTPEEPEFLTPGEYTDVLSIESIGVKSYSSYTSWSDVKLSSAAVYAGHSHKNNTAIQLRQSDNLSGIVSTKSGGKVKTVNVIWASNTTNGRILNVYGSNSKYESPQDLHDANKQGTLLGQIKKGQSTTLTVSGDYKYIGVRSSSAAMYLESIEITWAVEPASYTLAVGETRYSTLSLGYNATIPQGAKAYVVSEVNSGYVTLEEVTGVIPAKEAVIIEATPGNYNFVQTTQGAAVVETNLLEGTRVDTYITEEAYVLWNVDGEACFCKADITNGSFLNKANKAYLPASAVPANVKSLSFRFGEGTTGISEVTTENGEVKAIYDLTGRRIEAITAPGIYIVNGKKVLVK